jgi:hypothetical protein
MLNRRGIVLRIENLRGDFEITYAFLRFTQQGDALDRQTGAPSNCQSDLCISRSIKLMRKAERLRSRCRSLLRPRWIRSAKLDGAFTATATHHPIERRVKGTSNSVEWTRIGFSIGEYA